MSYLCCLLYLYIIGLILVTEPYHNEPGFEEGHVKMEKLQGVRRNYNHEILPRIATMILGQLKRPGKIWDQDLKIFYTSYLHGYVLFSIRNNVYYYVEPTIGLMGKLSV